MHNNFYSKVATALVSAGVLFYAAPGGGASTDISQTPLSTYAARSSIVVKPNILFVLDDSGSMDWNYMPDWANDRPANYSSLPEYLSKNSGFNGVAYNPAIRYQPPIAANANGTNDLTRYPSMDGTTTSTGADSTTKPNWKAVKNDGYGVQSTGTTNLVDNAYFYATVPGEYCNASNLRNCTTTSASSGSYAYPAPLRWCNSGSLTTCKATYDSDSSYTYPRSPAPYMASISFSSASTASITSVTLDAGGLQILSSSTSSSSTSSTVASRVASAINACSNSKTGNCTTSGYVATTSGSTVYIFAPGAATATPIVSVGGSGSVTVATSAFARGSNPPDPYWDGSSTRASATPPGNIYRVAISSTIGNSYAYPGATEKAPGRTDCAGTTCTYAEEMTNYANWWAYYRTRMQMMKSAMSRAFSSIDSADDIASGVSQFRVGFMTINNNAGNQFLNLGDFSLAQKQNWYNLLFGAQPNNSTPLRRALSDAGRLYGGNLTSLNGVTVTDPLQFSCQHNYTILSTDGFWNSGAGYKLDGSTAVGNQDAGYTGAYGDGGTAQWQQRTSQLQTRTNQQTAQKGLLQSSTSQLQSSTSQLQSSTSQLQSSTSQLQSSTSQLQSSTSQLQASTSTLLSSTLYLYKDTSSNSGSTWTNGTTPVSSCTWDTSGSSRVRCRYDAAWTTPSAAASCTPQSQGTNSSNNQTWSQAVACSYTAWATPQDVSSCTAVSQSSGSGAWAATARQCSYTSWTAPQATSSCTPAAQSSGSGAWTRSVATQCSYANWTTPQNTSSCTPVAQSSGSGAWTATARQCSYTAWTTPQAGASCTPAAQSSGTGAWGQAVAVQCSYAAWSTPQVAASCTPVAQSAGAGAWNSTAVQCSYGAWSTPQAAASCAPVTQSSGSGAWAPTARQCSYTAWSAYQNASSCTPVAQNSGSGTWSTATAVQCQYNWQATAPTATCSPTYVANNYANAEVYRNCATANGTWVPASSTCTVSATPDTNGYTTQCQYTAWGSWGNVNSCTPLAQSPSSPYTVLTAVDCQSTTANGTSDTLSDVAAYYYYHDLRSSNNVSLPAADRTGTCTGPTISPNTTPNDLCRDNVSLSGRDSNPAQHMTTFTIGLGAQGKMVYSDYQNDQSGTRKYQPDYWSQLSGDFYDVNQNGTPNSTTGICSWMASGKCTWPTPASDSNANIDDLWHAAVNGRGTYFSASDPTSLSNALENTLGQISKVPRPGAAAAAASSNPNITSSDNYIFSSSYRSFEWWGELIRQQLNSDGTLTAQQWSAMQLLDCAKTPWQASHTYKTGDVFGYSDRCYLVAANYVSGATFDAASVETTNTTLLSGGVVTRHIYTPNTAGSGLVSFDWNSMASSQQAYFKLPYLAYDSVAGSGLRQFCSDASDPNCLPSARQSDNTSSGAAGAALVNYLAGDRSHEGTDFRKRFHVLGDIVDSEARYVQKPMFNYADAGYSNYKTLHANRESAVYVAGNDGMLHAFNATTGTENWAFIPSAVLPQLYRLADINYDANHRYFVDGSPEVGDICPKAPGGSCSASEWRTILVGGLNAGGKSYYALDITDPANPTLLWEFTDASMGYSFGNPRISKLSNGTWVVLLTSGYNNADGVGRLYILNAGTGQLVNTVNATTTPGVISTGVGSTSNPSGLAKISAHVQYPMTDNTLMAVYGGDLLGNLWRFDVNNAIGAAGHDAQRLVTFSDASGKVQPITAKPVVTTINSLPVVFIGTGRYLGTGDVSNTDTQSFYAVKDTSGVTAFSNPRVAGSGFVQQTLTSTSCPAGADSSVCTAAQGVLTVSGNAVNWSSNNGWFMDFVVGGERSSTDPALGLGSLVFTTIKPNTTSADPCGEGAGDNSGSNVYMLDYLSGASLPGQSNVGGISLGLGIATRPVLIKDQDGSVRALIRQPGGTTGTDQGRTTVIKVKTKGGASGLRRISWRELNGE